MYTAVYCACCTCLAGNRDTEAWRQIGNRHSPCVPGAEAAPVCAKLMYAAEDLLHALTTAVAVVRALSAASAAVHFAWAHISHARTLADCYLCMLCLMQAPCGDARCEHCASCSRPVSNPSSNPRTSSSSTDSASSGQSQDVRQHTVQLTLLRAVHAPNRVWLQSFFAELQPYRRQVGNLC